MIRSRHCDQKFLGLITGLLVVITILPLNAPCQDKNSASWNQDLSFFPIMCWDPQHGWNSQHAARRHGLESIRDCNFSVAGFIHTKDISKCEKLGLKAFTFGDADDVTLRQWNSMWDDPTLTDSEIEEKIRKMVERTGNGDSVMGYYICDEPGASMFPRLAKAVEYVKKYAPGKLAYINLFPEYATLGNPNKSQLETNTYAEYIDRFVTEVKPQVLSYDNYKVQFSMDLSRKSQARSYYQNLLAVRKTALKHNLPFWNIVSSNQIRPFTTIPSPANLYFQAYTTLAAGGRGVTWYTYYSRGYKYAPVDTEGHKTLTWHFIKEINRQLRLIGPIMNHMTSTGVYFTSPPPVKSLPVLPGKLVKQVDAKTPMMVGEFKSTDGGDYAMVVNLSLRESIHFKVITQEKGKEITVISPADGRSTQFDKATGFWLVAGQGVLLKL